MAAVWHADLQQGGASNSGLVCEKQQGAIICWSATEKTSESETHDTNWKYS